MGGASQGKVGVNVAVRVLYLLNERDPVGQFFFQYRFLSYHLRICVIVDDRQGVGNGLDALVDIGILEYISLELIVGLAVQLLDGVHKVGLAAGSLLDLIDGFIQRIYRIYLLFGVPEIVGQLHILKGNRGVGCRRHNRLVDCDFCHRLKGLVSGGYGSFYLKGLSNLILRVQGGINLFPFHGNQFGVKLFSEIVTGRPNQLRRGIVKGDSVGNYRLGQDRSGSRRCSCLVSVNAFDAVHLDLQAGGPGYGGAVLLTGNRQLQGSVAAVLCIDGYLRFISRAIDLHKLAALCQFPLIGQSVQSHGKAFRREDSALTFENSLFSGDLSGNQLVPLGSHLLAEDFPLADTHAVGAGTVAVNQKTKLCGSHRLLKGYLVPVAVVPVQEVPRLVGSRLGGAVVYSHRFNVSSCLIRHGGDGLPGGCLVIVVLYVAALWEGYVAVGIQITVVRPVHNAHAVQLIGSVPGQGDCSGIGAAVPGVPGRGSPGCQGAVVYVGHRCVLGVSGSGGLGSHISSQGCLYFLAVHFQLADTHACFAFSAAVDHQTETAGGYRLFQGDAVPVAVGSFLIIIAAFRRSGFSSKLHAYGRNIRSRLIDQVGDVCPLSGAAVVVLQAAVRGRHYAAVVSPPHYPQAGDFVLRVSPVQFYGHRVVLIGSTVAVPGGGGICCQHAVCYRCRCHIRSQPGVRIGGNDLRIGSHILSGGNGGISKDFPLADSHSVGAGAAALDLQPQFSGGNRFRKLHIVPVVVVAVDSVVGAGIVHNSHLIGGLTAFIGHAGDFLLISLRVHIINLAAFGECYISVGRKFRVVCPPHHPHAGDYLGRVPGQGCRHRVRLVIGSPAVPAGVGNIGSQFSVVHGRRGDAPYISVGSIRCGPGGNVDTGIFRVRKDRDLTL